MTIQNANICAAAGKLSAGAICSHLTTPDTSDLSFEELIDLLEAQPTRVCVPVSGFPVCADDQTTGQKVGLPARGASMIMSSSDFQILITELQEACRQLGSGCSYEAAQTLKKLQ